MKVKKNLFIFILFCILLFNTILVNAESNYITDMKITKLNENSEIKVEMYLKEASERILGMQGKIEYNNEVLELENISSSNDAWNVTAFNKETGTFMMEINDDNFFNQEKYFGTGDKLIDILFKVKNEENTEVKISEIKMVNSEFATMEVEECSEKIILNSNNSFSVVIILLIVVLIVVIVIVIKRKNRKL